MKKISTGLVGLALLLVLAVAPQSASALSIEPIPTVPADAERRCEGDAGRLLDGRRLVGMRIDRGRRIAREAGCSFRVIVRRSEKLLFTGELDRSRLNYAVRDRRVTRFNGAF